MQTTWLERGTVSGRVALLLRSAEIQPLFERFVRLQKHSLLFNHPPLPYIKPNTKLTWICSRAGYGVEGRW